MFKDARYLVFYGASALAAAVLSCAVSAQEKGGEATSTPAPPITLKFDWGDQLEANVLAVREEISEAGDAVKASRIEARFRMHAQRSERGYAVTFSNLQMTMNGKPVPESSQPQMMGAIGGVVLNYDVAPNGDFIGLRDFESLQTYSERNYRTQNERLPEELRPSAEEAERAMKSGTSREVLQLDGARTWGALVGMWAGLPFTEGRAAYSESAVTIPVVNAPVTLKTSVLLVRREGCSTSDSTLACVRLRASSHPDEAQLAEAIKRFEKTTGRLVSDTGSLDVDYRVELVTEPGTLKPHHAEWSKGGTIANTEEGKERVQSRQSSKMTMTFDYPAAP